MDTGDKGNHQTDVAQTDDGSDQFSFRGAERYTMAEAARIKGVSYHTVSRSVRQGRLPVFRLGRMALIAGPDLENWQPMRERAPRQHRKMPEAVDPSGPAMLDEALGERMAVARQLSTLYEVIHAGSSELSMEGFGELLAQRFSSVFNLPRVSVWSADVSTRSGHRLAAVGDPMSLIPDSVHGESGFGKLTSVIEMGQARISFDPETEFADNPSAAWPMPGGPLLIVPLRAKNRTVGCIFGDREGETLTLDQDQISLAQVLGNQAALALDNAMLRKQEEYRIAQLSVILDQMSDQVRACDIHGRLNLMNRADQLLIGLDALPELGSDAMENPQIAARRELSGEPIPKSEHPLARALRGEDVTDWEYDVELRDGAVIRAVVSARPLVIDGEITGAVYIGRNVSEQREIERLERERADRNERARQRALAIAGMVDEANGATTADDVIGIALETLRRALPARGGFAFRVSETGELEPCAFNQFPAHAELPAMTDPISISTTILALSRNAPVAMPRQHAGVAEQRLMDLVDDTSALLVVPLQHHGRRTGVIYLMHSPDTPPEEEDIAFVASIARQCVQFVDRLYLREARDLARRHLDSVLARLPQAIVVVDAAGGQIASANAAALALLGDDIVPGATAATSVTFLDQHGEPLRQDRHPLLRAIREGTEIQQDALIAQRRDGQQRGLTAMHYPSVGSDGKVTGSVTVLQPDSRNGELDKAGTPALGTIVEEMLDSLLAIRIKLQHLEQTVPEQASAPGEPASAPAFVDVLEEFDHLHGVVAGLLDVTRSDAGPIAIQIARTDATTIIHSAVNRIGSGYPGRTIHADVPPAMPVAWDADRMEQVLCLLLDNAIRNAPDGPIDIEARELESGLVRITIRDHGPGIPHRLRERLFARIYPFGESGRADPVQAGGQHGLGLSLYLGSCLAEAHHGALTAGDAPGGGALLTLTLPRFSTEVPA